MSSRATNLTINNKVKFPPHSWMGEHYADMGCQLLDVSRSCAASTSADEADFQLLLLAQHSERLPCEESSQLRPQRMQL
jgi:hypothetical protein